MRKSSTNWMRSTLTRYTLAIVFVAAALLVALLLQRLMEAATLLLVAIMAATWFGGLGPGLLAGLLAALAVAYRLPPPDSFKVDIKDIPRLLFFLVAALFISWVSTTRRKAEDSLKKARDEVEQANESLERQVAERTAQLTRQNMQLVQEVTERKLAEEKVQENERELRLLTEVIPQQIWSALPDGSIEHCNQRVLTYLGRTMEEMRGFGFVEVLHPDDRDRILKEWQEAVSQGTVFDVEARHLGGDGQYRWFLARALPVRNAEGDIVKWYGTNTDIEDRKQAEQALLKAQTELAHLSRALTMGELAASIAHEVNQPLSAVVTNANACLRWLAGDTPNLGEACDAAKRIVRDGNRAAEVIRKIRTLLKKVPTQMVRLDVNELIREVMDLARSQIALNRVALRMRLGTDVPSVLGDRVQLQQVVLNLIMNSVEAIGAVRDGPRDLEVGSRRTAPDEVLVWVRDSGVGFDPANQDKLFDAFYTTKPGGMGMGLSISQSVIEAHGGKLRAIANDEGGASFQFTLAAAKESAR